MWLGLVAEAERELPALVVRLRGVTGDADGGVAAERRRIERLVLRGTQRAWLGYLSEVTELVRATSRHPEARIRAAALEAGAIVLEHHHMLIGLPGPGYAAAADQRAALTAALTAVPAA